jgi:hypothetical protein
VYEPPDRLDFFVYVRPSREWDEDALRSNFHLHVFLESNIKRVRTNEVVSFRIATILPKTTFVVGGERPNLAAVSPDEWVSTVQGMEPSCAATEEAARRFAAAVKSQQTAHSNAGQFTQMR